MATLLEVLKAYVISMLLQFILQIIFSPFLQANSLLMCNNYLHKILEKNTVYLRCLAQYQHLGMSNSGPGIFFCSQPRVKMTEDNSKREHIRIGHIQLSINVKGHNDIIVILAY